MHSEKVVDYPDVAVLPRDVDREFIGNGTRSGDIVRIERSAIAKTNRLGRIIAGVFPAFECRDELIKKTRPAIGQFSHGWKHRCGDGQIAVGVPLPRVTQLGQALFCFRSCIDAKGALPASPHAGRGVRLSRHGVGVAQSFGFTVCREIRLPGT